MLFAGYFGEAIAFAPQHDLLAETREGLSTAWSGDGARDRNLPRWFAVAGIVAAW